MDSRSGEVRKASGRGRVISTSIYLSRVKEEKRHRGRHSEHEVNIDLAVAFTKQEAKNPKK